jgi:hypothetical protein
MKGQMAHLDPQVLAEFRAGLIAGRRGAALAAHLADCDRCAALDQNLTEVSVLLAAVPPPALPDEVANRLDTVLAAEVAEGKDHPERAGADRQRTRRPAGRPAGWLGGNRRFRLVAIRVLAPAAAVVLAGVGYGLSQIGGSPQSSAASATAPRAIPSAGVHPAQVPQSVRDGAVAGTFGVVVSDTNYLPSTLSRQLEAALRESPQPATHSPTSLLKECVLHVTGDVIPSFVQRARYNGQPATVIVLSRVSGDEVWVVGSGCSATRDDTLATTTLPEGISAP